MSYIYNDTHIDLFHTSMNFVSNNIGITTWILGFFIHWFLLSTVTDIRISIAFKYCCPFN